MLGKVIECLLINTIIVLFCLETSSLRFHGFVTKKHLTLNQLTYPLKLQNVPEGDSSGFEKNPFPQKSELIEPSTEDMKHMAYMLANITEYLDSQPQSALSIVSQQMGWLFQRNVPKLTEMLLQQYPVLREDDAMRRAYIFVIDFLEAVGKETSSRMRQNQDSLRIILEAAKISEAKIEEVIVLNREKVTSPEFFVYLDAEIEGQDVNSQLQSLLVTIMLRLLDELGKSMGVDVMILPKLAAEENPAELRRKTAEHLKCYSVEGKELFMQTLRIMKAEMAKRYKALDPILLVNLGEVEKVAQSLIDTERRNANK